MATLYFFNTVAAADTDWYTLENWWTDVGLTTQASSLPSSADNVFLLSMPSNSGSEPTVNAITADASLLFLVFPITVTTIATFNYDSQNRSTITGDAIFNTSSVNYNGMVTGDATFNNNSYADVGSTVGGNVTLNNNGLIIGAIVSGDATFNNSEITNVMAGAYANIEGTITFNNPIVFTFSGENYPWEGASDTWVFNDTHEWVFDSGACNRGYVNGNATFHNNSANFNLATRSATVYGDAVFNDSSFNGDVVTGNATFNDSATNSNSGYMGTVQGNGIFSQTSFVGIDWISDILGTVTFTSETPVTFTISDDIDWNLDTTGWTFDTPGQSWIFNNTAHNTSIINGDVTFNNTSYNSNYDGNTNSGALINGNVIFNTDSYNLGRIIGSAIFNDTSSNGVRSELNIPSHGVDGIATFNDYSWNFNNAGDGSIFNDLSYNNGQVNGDAIFNDNSSNGIYPDTFLAYGGIVTNDAYFNNNSYNYSLSTVDGTSYFSPSAAEVTIRYNCGGTDPSFLISSPEIVYQKGINGSSILGLL
ncbi:hypothetical protein EB001_06180 [bacterium]|nr:hypothetical protein [bacterium]